MARHLVMILVDGSDEATLTVAADRIVNSCVQGGRRVVECDPGVDMDEIVGDYYGEMEEQLDS